MKNKPNTRKIAGLIIGSIAVVVSVIFTVLSALQDGNNLYLAIALGCNCILFLTIIVLSVKRK